MPEYVLPGRDSLEFRDLDDFVRGYIEAAFFTAPEDEGLDDLGFHDLPQETVEQVIEECEEFVRDNAADLDTLYEADPDYGEAEAGRDFWFTRNGHGVGYWDRGFTGDAAEAAESLTQASEAWGEVYLGKDDDDNLTITP